MPQAISHVLILMGTGRQHLRICAGALMWGTTGVSRETCLGEGLAPARSVPRHMRVPGRTTLPDQG
eukprot:12642896-Alexandrium_andersonii.AAC.1